MNLLRSKRLANVYEIKVINTTVRSTNEEKGRLDLMMLWAYVRYLAKLFMILITWRPDHVLYLPTSATVKGWIRDGTTLLLAWLLRLNSVVLFQGGHFRHFFNSLGQPGRWIIHWLLNRCEMILVQADALKSQFRGIVPEQRIRRFYNTIDSEFFQHFEGVAMSFHKQEVTILFVGHFSTAKGYCDLMRTVPLLAQKHRVKYQLMGLKIKTERNVLFNQATGERIPIEDPDKCYAEHVQANRLESKVEFLGAKVYGAEKLKVFEKADIFVLPSYSEGFSTAMLEAMAAGLPVIVTAVGAAPEVIKDGVNGYVIKPGDLHALSSSLDSLVSNPTLRSDMGHRNRELCRQLFLTEAGAQNLIDLLESTP
jgi:glycosyltransferase involved in cell wall biosynthesis